MKYIIVFWGTEYKEEKAALARVWTTDDDRDINMVFNTLEEAEEYAITVVCDDYKIVGVPE